MYLEKPGNKGSIHLEKPGNIGSIHLEKPKNIGSMQNHRMHFNTKPGNTDLILNQGIQVSY